MSKRIFLTGANGFLGSYLTRALALEGWTVVCLLRSQKGELAHDRLNKALRGICANPAEATTVLSRCSVMEGAIGQPRFGMSQADYGKLATGFDCVLHCAAMTTFDSAHAEKQWHVNVDGTEHMSRFAADCVPPYGYHYISTAYVAGDRTDMVYEQELDKGQGFLNGYEKSKFEAEKIIGRYRERGMPITIYRPSIIVGDSSSGQTVLFNGMYMFVRFLDSVRTTFEEKDSRGRIVIPVRALGNPSATKNFVHINYVVATAMAIFNNPQAHGGTYHITHEQPPTLDQVREAVEEVLEICGTQFVGKSDFEKMPPTDLEIFLREQSALYAPYLLSEPLFDRSAIRKVLPPDQIPDCPPMDRTALLKLFSYALASRWGRRKVS